MPVVEKGTQQLVIYHQGSQADYKSSIFLLPDSDSAIVVLTTSTSLNSCADRVGQLVLEALIDSPERNDYKKYAKQSADAHIASVSAMRKPFEEHRIPNTSPRPLRAYPGRYYNSIRNFFIEISICQDSGDQALQMALQDLCSQIWKLEHYHYDTFLWLMSRDQAAKRGRFTYSPAKLYRFDFGSNEHCSIESLTWARDGDLPGGEVFTREHGTPHHSAMTQGIFEPPMKAM
jgi:hypothetical protein